MPVTVCGTLGIHFGIHFDVHLSSLCFFFHLLLRGDMSFDSSFGGTYLTRTTLCHTLPASGSQNVRQWSFLTRLAPSATESVNSRGRRRSMWACVLRFMIISCARHSTQGNGNTVAITVLLQLHHTRKVVKVDALLKARQPQDQPGAWGVDLCRGSRHACACVLIRMHVCAVMQT